MRRPPPRASRLRCTTRAFRRLFSYKPFPCSLVSSVLCQVDTDTLTVRVTFQERVQYLQVTGHLLPCSSLASGIVDVLGNQFIAAIGLSLFRPFPSAHRRICFEG